jgi:hypothetical protein
MHFIGKNNASTFLSPNELLNKLMRSNFEGEGIKNF